MTLWETVLLGAIQGLFMFVPVSSSSHLVLIQQYLADQGRRCLPRTPRR